MDGLRGVRLLAMMFMDFAETGEVIYLNHGIRLGEELVARATAGPNRASLLCNLSCMLGARFEVSGSLQDLEEAIRRAEEGLPQTLPNHPDRARILTNLGSMLEKRGQRLGDPNDLDQAIVRTEEALTATPLDDPDRARTLSNLGLQLRSRYERLGAMDDLERAIARAQEALAATHPQNPDRALILENLCNMFESRYNRLGDLDDLELAIVGAEEALTVIPPGHPARALMLSDLGIKIYNRYKQSGDLEDLQQAISRNEGALAAIPPDHPARSRILNALSTMLGSRHQRLGDLEDIQQAIARAIEALADTPQDHHERAHILGNLGNRLFQRFERLGNLEDLEDSIRWDEEALAVVSLDYPDRASMLSNLGGKLRGRYERVGALEDLEEAIRLDEEALEAIPLDHTDRAALLNNLGLLLELKYQHAGDIEVLEQAIIRSIEAIADTPLEHYNRSLFLSNLADKFGRKSSKLGTLEDLQEAIEWQEQAIEATPPNHPNRVHLLENMAHMTFARYQHLKDPADSERAIILGEEALAETPHDHPIRATLLNNLGARRILRHMETNSEKDFAEGLHTYLEASNCDMSPPLQRIIGAIHAGMLLNTQKRWQESSPLYEMAVKMLSKVSPRSLGRDDQQKQLSEFPWLAAIAAAVALQAGEEASHSLQLLEFGRGIIVGFSIDCRSDLTELQLGNPEIFDKFNRLRTEIDGTLAENSQGYDGFEAQRRSYALKRRKQAINEMEETLTHIRQLDGFEGFQLPPSPEDMMVMATEGPIVIVNPTLFRSDAIIVTTSSIKALPLPGLAVEEAIERIPTFRDLTRGKLRTLSARNNKMKEQLLWLWDAVVEPILKELQFIDVASDTGTPTARSTEKPHIWWIGVKVMSLAPFHAAGDHSSGSTRNTLNYAVSSYIPSIKALSYARQKKLQLLSEPDARLLLVTMSTTPGQSSLDNVAQEVEEIIGTVKDNTTIIPTLLDRPNAVELLEKIPSYHAIHFACHGVSDSENPSQSHLLLLNHDSSGSEIADKLSVGAISHKNIKHAQIAYLSACCTADNPSVWLADEGIHIANGFQLAGFSHVLGTLWQANDAASLQIAKDFYSFLFNGQGDGHRNVSSAFHDAVKRLQEQYPNQPIKWVPFIHIGA